MNEESIPRTWITQNERPWDFWQPRSFDPCSLSESPADLLAADAMRHMVSSVLRKQTFRCVDEQGYVRLHSKALREIIGARQLSRAKRALIDGDVLETDPYQAGVKSYGYRLTQRFLADKPVFRRPVHPDVRARIIAFRKRAALEQQSLRKPIDDDLEREQCNLTIGPDAYDVLETLGRHSQLCQTILVDRIRDRHYYYKVGDTLRRYNSLTGLHRKLRPCLRFYGCPLASLDLVSCQPALLAFWLLKLSATGNQTPANRLQGVETYNGYSVGCPVSLIVPSLPPACVARLRSLSFDVAEVDRFRLLVGSGDFYRTLASWVPDDALEPSLSASSGDRGDAKRHIVKHRFLVDVLAKKGRYASAVEQAFQREFPGVHAFVRAINHDDHGELIRALQRLEATLVVETVAPRLVDHIPIVTLHDAIFCRQGDEAEVERVFHEVFGELDFHIGLKTEQWGPPTSAERRVAA